MKLWSMLLGLAVAAVLATGLVAEEKKEVELKGTMKCAKCTLKEADAKACANVLIVKEGDKEVKYYLKDKGNKEAYHKGICPPGSEAEATVKGSVTEEDGKKIVTATKVDVKKK